MCGIASIVSSCPVNSCDFEELRRFLFLVFAVTCKAGENDVCFSWCVSEGEELKPPEGCRCSWCGFVNKKGKFNPLQKHVVSSEDSFKVFIFIDLFPHKRNNASVLTVTFTSAFFQLRKKKWMKKKIVGNKFVCGLEKLVPILTFSVKEQSRN